mgnify:CR=1 FL=1
MQIVRMIDRNKLIEILQKDKDVKAYGLVAIVKIFEENSYDLSVHGKEDE